MAPPWQSRQFVSSKGRILVSKNAFSPADARVGTTSARATRNNHPPSHRACIGSSPPPGHGQKQRSLFADGRCLFFGAQAVPPLRRAQGEQAGLAQLPQLAVEP